jgi:hypothetical protein
MPRASTLTPEKGNPFFAGREIKERDIGADLTKQKESLNRKTDSSVFQKRNNSLSFTV